jgi:glutaminyl-tRNA synthetase
VDHSDAAPVFNKIVGLKDSWGKRNKAASAPSPKKAPEKKVQIDGEVAPMTEAEQTRFDSYTSDRGLGNEVANTLARDAQLASFFEAALAAADHPVTIANLVSNEVARELKEKEIDALQYDAAQIAALAAMVDDGTISNKIAKQVFEEMAANGGEPAAIVEAKGLVQISDPAVIGPIIDEIIAKNPDNVAKFRGGNTKLLGFFVGQVLKSTGGKANPQVVNTLVAQKLG